MKKYIIKMMKHIIMVYLCFIFISCHFSSKQEIGSVNGKSDLSGVAKDTLITYNLEGISTECAEANVNYMNGIINKSIIYIYAGTWQATIVYEFEENKIKVLETKYSYNVEIDNVKADKDMQIDYKRSYFIDFNGNLLGNEFSERIDVFKEFEDVVPLKLY